MSFRGTNTTRLSFGTTRDSGTTRRHKKRSRLRFGVYVGKQKCLDRFFENLRGATKHPCVVAYGASSLKPGGKGEMSVPVGRVLKTCQRYFQTSLVNEYLTTKKHHKCCGTMNPVCHKGVEDPRAIRGLYWCPTCREFVNRDRNPCLNILKVFRAGEERPGYLAFGQERVKMKTLALLPPPQKKNFKNKSAYPKPRKDVRHTFGLEP